MNEFQKLSLRVSTFVNVPYGKNLSGTINSQNLIKIHEFWESQQRQNFYTSGICFNKIEYLSVIFSNKSVRKMTSEHKCLRKRKIYNLKVYRKKH